MEPDDNAEQAVTAITLAHLSDLHLAHDGLRFPAWGLLNKRMTSQFSWRHRRRFLHVDTVLEALVADLRAMTPDAVALTGDLTNLGLPVEYRRAAAWVATRLPEQTAIVPGNHDMLVSEPWDATLGLWKPWMAARPQDFPFVRRVGMVALIGVNSACPTPWFSAAGRIGPAQAAHLADLLHETGREGAFRVVMIHHPPVPGIVSRRKALRDAGLFAAAIARSGAELVLHGHSHRSGLSSLPGPTATVPVLGIASASMLAPEQQRTAAWHHIRITCTKRGYAAEFHRRLVAPGRPVRQLPPWRFDVYRLP
ncbi:metallophosphoesterase [Gluconacetobacter sacchari DSM 12717]|uniref:Metallophosphoesterase n=2 Tax=Gluconacetobacter sacchari TaxID=92759 RepID=A0A7W4IFN5_9PROT|nr:metallophosphoesterase [Gluconacetobacter sacchari]GBQ27911.1 metallophosphoesterase [Gluconacetobacter sacchari DSM 12717]